MTSALVEILTTVLVASVRAMVLLVLVRLALARLPSSASARALVWRLTFALVLLLPLASALPDSLLVETQLTTQLRDLVRQTVAAIASDRFLPATGALAGTSGVPTPGATGSTDDVSAPAVLLAGLWIAGVALVVARGLHGWRSAARIARSGTDAGATWQALARAIATSMRVVPAPWVVLSSHAAVPALLGLGRRVVLVPVAAASWPSAMWRIVLVHEIAHLRRGDAWAWLAERAVCAVHWFNPVVWLAARWWRAERERACDDHVLLTGVDPHDYATRLVDTACARTTAAPCLAAPALPLAPGIAQLEARLRAVLDPGTIRTDPSRRLRVALSAGVLTATLALSAVRSTVPASPEVHRLRLGTTRSAELVVEMPNGGRIVATGGPFEIRSDAPVRYEWRGDTLSLEGADAQRLLGRVEVRSGASSVGAVIPPRPSGRAYPAGSVSPPAAARIRISRDGSDRP